MVFQIGSLHLRETELSRRNGIAVLNSSCPWSSTAKDLTSLYYSIHTVAVTTRTAVVSDQDVDNIRGNRAEPFQSVFQQDQRVHNHSFLRDSLKTIEGGRLTVARGSLK